MILGIDIGGTTVKFGLVDTNGTITEQNSYDTHSWEAGGEAFVKEMIKIAKDYQSKTDLTGIGIGVPGLLSVDRKSTVRLPNIPVLNDIPLVELMAKEFGDLPIRIENDAKCAALGEKYFGTLEGLDNYMLITLGTGVGSGLILHNKLFIGGRGNATEIGHIPVHTGDTLENCIGQEKITAYTYKLLENNRWSDSALFGRTDLSPKVIFESALKGDQAAREVFEYVGDLLGEAMVGIIRVLDINTFLLGGGVAGAFEFLKPAIERKLKKYLPNYYTDGLSIREATMKSNAGILGAASLIMHVNENIVFD